MRWLIDGYNVMYVAGVIDSKMSRERFRKARKRFLDHLASCLGDMASEATIVFDANKPPADFPLESTYRRISVIFALSDPSADARIERILARHSTPKALTVVSSDREVRQSATRRKARAMKADEFLDKLPTLAYQRRAPMNDPDPEAVRTAPALDDAERAYWEEVFGVGEVEPPPQEPPASKKPAPNVIPPAPDRRRVEKPRRVDVDVVPSLRHAMITDADIAAIRREVEREG